MLEDETGSSKFFVVIFGIFLACIFSGGCITETVCPQANETPYIIINPISTHSVGDVFEINGTTNLGVDDKIKIDISELRMTGTGPYSMPDLYYNYSDSRSYVTMKRGDCGENSWSYRANLTGFHSRTVYDVKVYSEQNRTIINYSGFFIRRDD